MGAPRRRGEALRHHLGATQESEWGRGRQSRDSRRLGSWAVRSLHPAKCDRAPNVSGDLGRHSPTPGGLVLLSLPRPSGLGFPGPWHPLQLPSFSRGPSQRTLAHRALSPEGRGWGGLQTCGVLPWPLVCPSPSRTYLLERTSPTSSLHPLRPGLGKICLQYICPDAWKPRNLLVQSPAVWATGRGVERLGGEGGRASSLTGQGQAFCTLAPVSVDQKDR